MAWQELPSGADVAITAPNFYAIVARVGAQHSKADIIAQATSRGLKVFQYSESSADASGYRQVAAQAQATSSGSSIPWAPSFPASLVAHYNLTAAWWSPPTDQPLSTQASIAGGGNVGAVVVVALAALVGGYLWLRGR